MLVAAGMKTWLLVLSLVMSSATLAQTPMLESQKEAIRLYPDLADKESKFNKLFVQRISARKVSDPSFLQRDDWPLSVAKRVAAELGAANITAPAPAVNSQVAKMPIDPANRLGVSGEVIQRLTEGTLVKSSGVAVGGWRGLRGVVLVRGHEATMGEKVKLTVFPSGTFTYTSTDGGENTK